MTKKSGPGEEKSFQEMVDEARSSFEYHLEGFRYDLTEQIAVALERSELSKTAFAEKLGVSKGRITQLLDGSNNFTLETLVKISEALETELRLTLRPRGWEQVREYTKPCYTPKVTLLAHWSAPKSIGNAGGAKSISIHQAKATIHAFATAA
jgi:transcriptional regulator with XRE-family HTH domain